MTAFPKTLLAVGLVVLTVGLARAQAPQVSLRDMPIGLVDHRYAGGAGLLVHKIMRKELKITDEQAARLDKLRGDLNEEMHTMVAGLSGKERVEMILRITQIQHPVLILEIGKILRPEQLARFEQIQLQLAGAYALARPDIEKTLKLTDEQKAKVQKIGETWSKATHDAIQKARANGQRATEGIAGLRKEVEASILEMLTPDQKTQWKTMIGPPFTPQRDDGSPSR
jgi:Spy/CpxP family protein refolding chaperone